MTQEPSLGPLGCSHKGGKQRTLESLLTSLCNSVILTSHSWEVKPQSGKTSAKSKETSVYTDKTKNFLAQDPFIKYDPYFIPPLKLPSMYDLLMDAVPPQLLSQQPKPQEKKPTMLEEVQNDVKALGPNVAGSSLEEDYQQALKYAIHLKAVINHEAKHDENWKKKEGQHLALRSLYWALKSIIPNAKTAHNTFGESTITLPTYRIADLLYYYDRAVQVMEAKAK